MAKKSLVLKGTNRSKSKPKKGLALTQAKALYDEYLGDGHRRSVYDSTFHPASMLSLAKEGCTLAEILDGWGVTKKQCQNWLQKHPEFKKSYILSAQALEAFWANKLKDAALGKNKVHLNLWAFSMYSKNILGWDDQGGRKAFSDANDSEYSLIDLGSGQTYNADGKQTDKDEE